MSPCGWFLWFCPVRWKQCRLSATGQACILLAHSTLPQSRAKEQMVCLSWRCFTLSYQKSHQWQEVSRIQNIISILQMHQTASVCCRVPLYGHGWKELQVHFLLPPAFSKHKVRTFFLQTGRTPSTRINIQAIKQAPMVTSESPMLDLVPAVFLT